MPQQGLGVVRIVRESTDADRAPRVERRAVQIDRILERLDHPLQHERNHPGSIRRRKVGQQDEELVAALPGDQVDVSRRSSQSTSQPCQQEVTRVVAHRVVQVLEVVEVQVEDRDRGLVAPCALDVLVRGDSLQRRAMTVLHEALELSRTHMANVRDAGAIPRPGLLKVAVDAAAEVRQIVSARNATGKDGGPTVNINITRNHATVIQGAFRESGVDLTDVLGDMFNTPAIPTTATVIAKE